MSKKVKMVLYGNPGVGKSVFASKSPNPFFITTDGNYEWLEEFGAKEKDHIQVNSWDQAKKTFDNSFDGYDTIVVDLVEDLFKWCEQEFCIKNKISHIGDLGFGKGYDISRNEFFIEISKLFAKDKHVILISHGITLIEKDRRGVEHTKYAPSNRIPDKVWDMIEGRTRYFLRCYLQAETLEDEKTVIKKRYLSLIPKENEFGVCRGINENIFPQDIPLDWKTFANTIGLGNEKEITSIKPNLTEKQFEQAKEVLKEKVQIIESVKEDIESKQGNSQEKQPDAGDSQIDKLAALKAKIAQKKQAEENKSPVEESKQIEENQPPFEPDPIPSKEEIKPAEQSKSVSNADKIAAIKAKIAAQKALANK